MRCLPIYMHAINGVCLPRHMHPDTAWLGLWLICLSGFSPWVLSWLRSHSRFVRLHMYNPLKVDSPCYRLYIQLHRQYVIQYTPIVRDSACGINQPFFPKTHPATGARRRLAATPLPLSTQPALHSIHSGRSMPRRSGRHRRLRPTTRLAGL